MVRVRSPGVLLAITAYALSLVVASIVAAALHFPSVGLSFSRVGADILAVDSHNAVVDRLKPTAPIAFSGGGRTLLQPAVELVSEFEPSGSAANLRRWYADQDLLSAILGQPDARVEFLGSAGMQRIPLSAQKRGLRDLPPDVWLLLAEACGVGLLGIWMIVLRPHDWAARLFLVSSLGIALASFSGALVDARELAANGAVLRWGFALNLAGSNIGPSALLALFLVQPRPIVGPKLAMGLVTVAAAWGLAVGGGLAPMGAYYAGLLAMTGAFMAILAAQWLLSKSDPAARAVVRWVGLTTLIGSGALALAMVAKQAFGGSSLGGDGLSILPIFLVYGGIAFGVGRYRLFDLDRWAFRVIVGALAAAALLLADAGLILGLKIDARAALGLSILGVGYLYLPIRSWLWRRIAGGPSLGQGDLFQMASDVAFLLSVSERRAGWRSLLQRLFDPLEIALAVDHLGDVEVLADGAALHIPAAADESALLLRYRGRGQLLFDSGQAALARGLVKFMHHAERTRDEYARGAAEERQRISRDLHDDVSGRLLTGLRRADIKSMGEDVRAALADIRTILRGLSGEVLPISQVVANMRHETFERLDAAGIGVDWPVELDPASDPVLEYLHYRNITSAHREVITNILRHSNAKTVRVRYSLQDGSFSLTVEDDGIGMPVAPQKAGGGRGLGNIKRRLAELGGAACLEDAAPGLRVRLTAAVWGP